MRAPLRAALAFRRVRVGATRPIFAIVRVWEPSEGVRRIRARVCVWMFNTKLKYSLRGTTIVDEVVFEAVKRCHELKNVHVGSLPIIELTLSPYMNTLS